VAADVAQWAELLNVVVILSKADAVDVSVAVTLDLQCIRGTSASPKSFIGRIADSTRSCPFSENRVVSGAFGQWKEVKRFENHSEAMAA
jgi:hypothetical protein